MARGGRLAAAAALAALALTGPAVAQQRFTGRWTIAAAEVAPWADDPNNAADTAEARKLVGQPVSFSARALAAPEFLGCKRPTYAFRQAAADTLFEGGLTSDAADRPADAVATARKLGITAAEITGMTASCSEVEFFLADPNRILFALNNRIYTLKRQP